MYGNTLVTTVTVAIVKNGPKIAYFSHSARTAQDATPKTEVRTSSLIVPPPSSPTMNQTPETPP